MISSFIVKKNMVQKKEMNLVDKVFETIATTAYRDFD